MATIVVTGWPWLGQKAILLVLILIRLLNAFTLRTFFQPDEYFQSLDPAWLMAFGPNTAPWITWEWKYRLRSSLHPRVFAIMYVTVDIAAKAVALPPPVRAKLLIAAPKLAQGVMAGVSDWYTWKLAEKVFGKRTKRSKAVLFMTVLNMWNWYVSTRTFSNSLETVLTVSALYYWPWRLFGDANREETKALGQTSEIFSLRLSLLLAAFAVLLRPPSIILWASIATLLLARFTLDGESPITVSIFVVLVREIILCGALALFFSLLSDKFLFGKWVLPQWNFVSFNIVQSLSSFYGLNSWHHYVSQSIPLLSLGSTPFVFTGLGKALGGLPEQGMDVRATNIFRTLAIAATNLTLTLSLIAHKEHRFIFPLLPIFHLLAAPTAVSYFLGRRLCEISIASKFIRWRKFVLASLLGLNVIVGGYLSYFHARSQINILDFLRHEWETRHPNELQLGTDHWPLEQETSFPGLETFGSQFAVFLVPCHTTPWRSHLVYSSLSARALTCDPPINTLAGSEERNSFQNEEDMFYSNITRFLSLPRDHPWSLGWDAESAAKATGKGTTDGLPTFIIGFSGIEEDLFQYFEHDEGKQWGINLVLKWDMWNGFFNDERKRRGRLMAWEIVPRQTQN